MTAAATPALAALIAAGVPHEVVKFDHNSRERSFGVGERSFRVDRGCHPLDYLTTIT